MTLERIPVPAGMIPVLMLVVLVVPACSQDPTAELRQRAEQGDTEAQYDLGLMYANGEGVARDDEQAVRWFRSAAEVFPGMKSRLTCGSAWPLRALLAISEKRQFEGATG